MSKDKRTFFERLTGTVRMDNQKEERDEKKITPNGNMTAKKNGNSSGSWLEEEVEDEGELTVDVYQTPDMIIVKGMIAGVRPEDLDITISRDMVTLRGHREEERVAREEDYFTRELYWGSFSRTIQLPEEIDVEESEAIEKHGLLILKLPKLDKKRQSKLKVKTV